MVLVRCVPLALTVAIGISAVNAQTGAHAGAKVRLVTGVVKTVSPSSLTIERRPGKEISFAVNGSTRFVGKGLASDLLLRIPARGLADTLKPGDRVTVKFRESGSALNAVEVRVVER